MAEEPLSWQASRVHITRNHSRSSPGAGGTSGMLARILARSSGRFDIEHERDVHGGEFAHRVAIAEAAGGVTGVSPWI